MSEIKNMESKSASPDQLRLYCLMGEALCAIHLLEDCLSHSIALKKDVKHPDRMSRKEADAFLANYRSYTLGKAIKLVKKEKLLTTDVENSLESFLSERNWFVHKSLYESLDGSSDGNSFEHCKTSLFIRIKSLVNQAQMLHHLIEEDILSFSEKAGLDMSNVREAKERYYL